MEESPVITISQVDGGQGMKWRLLLPSCPREEHDGTTIVTRNAITSQVYLYPNQKTITLILRYLPTNCLKIHLSPQFDWQAILRRGSL